MTDTFAHYSKSLQSPASYLAAVTPSDTEDLARVTRALNVGVAGTIRVTTIEDTTADIYVVAGAVFPVRAKRIWATGTTATNIVAML